MSLSLDSENTLGSFVLSFEIGKKKGKPLSASHAAAQHIWVCSTNHGEVLKDKKEALPSEKKKFKKRILKVPFLLDCVDEVTVLKRNKPVLKLGARLRKRLTHLSLCILGKTARQSQKSRTGLMKPSEQALSDVALVLSLCTWEYVTPDRASSDPRSVCPREKNVNSQNRFIPLLQVRGDKQYRDGSCSRQHHIQTTQWWAQNKYQDCKIDLPSTEIQLSDMKDKTVWENTRLGKGQS